MLPMLNNNLVVFFTRFRKTLLLMFIFSIGLSLNAIAQDYMGCGTKYSHRDQPSESEYSNDTDRDPSIKYINGIPDVRVVLPVVVHVVRHPTETEVDDAHINIMLSYLNQAFTGKNNQDDVREQFVDLIGNPNIEFALVKEDQNGSSFNGINRREIDDKLLLDRDIKSPEMGSEAWDTKKVINIWICDLGFDTGSNVAGYSSIPSSTKLNFSMDLATDGIVLDSHAIGYYNIYNTLVHEMGHYLGLNHTWGDGSCITNDGIDDTPPCSSASKPNHCSQTVEQCENTTLHENFMDYSKCRSMFTKGQVEEMHKILYTVRKGLLDDNSSSLSQIAVYPNPSNTSDHITVKEIYGNVLKEIDVYGVNGQLVKSFQYINDYEHIVDTKDFSPGLYFIRVRNDINHEETLKIVLR